MHRFVCVVDEPQDIYWYTQALYLNGQYPRAAHMIRLHQLDKVLTFTIISTLTDLETYK